MIETPERELVKYRICQAREALEDIQLLLDHNRYRAAANRLYYAAFYAALAALLIKGYQFSKHSAVIAFFDREYIKTQIFPREYSKCLHKAFQERQDNDYMPFIDFDPLELTLLFHEVKAMVHGVETYLKDFLQDQS